MFSFLKSSLHDPLGKKQKAIINAFPSSLKFDATFVAKLLPYNEYPLHNYGKSEVEVDNESFTIPYRVWFDKFLLVKKVILSKQQKTILACIYSRHYDWYVREEMLRKLILSDEAYVIPYIIKLAWEYVVELLTIIDSWIHESNIAEYNKFYKNNQAFFKEIESRMASFWDRFYRTDEFNLFSKYIWKRILNRIKFYTKEEGK